MKRKINLMVLLMSISILIITSASQASAQNRLIPIGDSGIVWLGLNQVLRVSVAAGDVTGDGEAIVRFRQIKYEPCQASPKLCIAQQSLSNAILLAANEGASFDAADYVLWRTVVLSNRKDVKVSGIVFDTSTQRVVTQISMANTEGDFH